MTTESGRLNDAHQVTKFVKPLSFFFMLAFIIFSIVTSTCYASLGSQSTQSEKHDTFDERLLIKPLEDGKLFAQFEFRTTYRKAIKGLRWENKFEIFPLSLADLVASADLERLHFSLTKGNWNYRNWGYPSRSSPPGAQIQVQFSAHNEDPARSWRRLVNSLAGKFCASLSSADERSVVQTKFTFPPTTRGQSQASPQTYYTNLPEETLCTGNLTPWKKLLPCYSKAGLSTLLNAIYLLKSSYSSLAIDLEPVDCSPSDTYSHDNSCEQVKLLQTISIVFNPLEQFDGKQSWSLAKIFGDTIKTKCPSASKSLIYVDITKLDDKTKLNPPTYDETEVTLRGPIGSREKRVYAIYDVINVLESPSAKYNTLDVRVKQNQLFKRPAISSRPTIPVYLTTHVAGVGTSDGRIVATISNNLNYPVRVTYTDVLPHFLRVFTQTLSIRAKSGQELQPDRLNFVLADNDNSPTLIELSLVVPALTSAQLSYEFQRVFLRWTDHKPDANKGILMSAASISVELDNIESHLVFPNLRHFKSGNETQIELERRRKTVRVYARPLLIILPTPDFSMSYNVICLVCSVIVAAFGPLHSVATRKPFVRKLKDESDTGESQSDRKESQEPQTSGNEADETRKNK